MVLASRSILAAVLGLVAFGLIAPRTESLAADDRKPTGLPLVTRSAYIHREVACAPGTMVVLTAGPWGNVRVVGRRTNVMSIDGRVELKAPGEADLQLLASVISILADTTPTTIEVLTKGPHDKKWMKNFKKFPDRLKVMPWRVDYMVVVPEFTSLTIDVGEGEAVVENVQGIVSVVSLHGDIRAKEVSGATRLTAYAGNVEITTSQRTWRGGNLSASASGDVTINAPRGFSGDAKLKAQGGILLRGDRDDEPGQTFEGFIGNGGPGLELTSGGRLTIAMGKPVDRPSPGPGN
ncbi:MAG: hypothetical protein IT175_17515 [Acidobacteria bacterium]|nr:hypothetical protein [Acidobacteriota bacterium]